MTSQLFSSVSIITLFLALNSCGVDYDPNDPTQPTTTNHKSFHDVDERLWSYFEKFETESLERGLSYDLNALGITGVIENIPENGVAGTCQYGQHIHHVTVDLNYWSNASQNQREMVVFHELGHCVLSRGHREDSNAQGYCRSIMHSGLTDCVVAYNGSNIPVYLDELFYNL